MTIEEAETYYGNLSQVAHALNLTPQNQTRWRRQGYLPWAQQFRLAQLTRGKLQADKTDPKMDKARKVKNL